MTKMVSYYTPHMTCLEDTEKALNYITVEQVCAFLEMCEADEKEIYIKLLAKTLRLGVTAKSVNKVIPALIPSWEVQQAYSIDEHPIKDGEWFALTQKLNVVKYAILTEIGILLFRTGQAHALVGRGYEALGGEVFALFLPVLYWILSSTVRDILSARRERAHGGRQRAARCEKQKAYHFRWAYQGQRERCREIST